jgi:enoyl-CoA hydratase/carnithine racemase
MNELFNYSTLEIKLIKNTRTLQIAFREGKNKINLETLFELESIFAWASSRVEVHSILFTSHNEFFNEGLCKERVVSYSSDKILKITQKLQKIVHAMYHLPQTIIIDMRNGAFDLGSELALGADIRCAHQDTIIAFNHNRVGLTPSSGGIGFLNTIVGQSFSRSWIMLGKEIPRHQLLNSGFIDSLYLGHGKNNIDEYLQLITQSAPVQRIQSKLGLLECVRENLDEVIKFERSIQKASLISEDWKDEKPMDAKSFSYAVKRAKELEFND